MDEKMNNEIANVDTYEAAPAKEYDSVSADEAAMSEDNNLLIGVGIGALGVLAGSFLWKKALKPGLKKVVNYAQAKLNKDETEAESGEEKPETVDGEVVKETPADSSK